jgi:hypothetical protein
MTPIKGYTTHATPGMMRANGLSRVAFENLTQNKCSCTMWPDQ